MKIETPCYLKPERISELQVELARRGVCPRCKQKRLIARHRTEQFSFLQCASCETVVALDRIE